MNKQVIYNGGTKTKDSCDSSSLLQKGKQYELVQVIPLYFQSNYVLKGVEGSFNSAWFDEVTSAYKEEYIATSSYEPIVGCGFRCYRIVKKGRFIKKIAVQKITTSPVISVEKIMTSALSVLYKVETQHSIYYVQIR